MDSVCHSLTHLCRTAVVCPIMHAFECVNNTRPTLPLIGLPLLYFSQSLSLMRLSCAQASNQARTVKRVVTPLFITPIIPITVQDKRSREKCLQNWTLAYFICVCSLLLFFGSYRSSLKDRPVDRDRRVGDHCFRGYTQNSENCEIQIVEYRWSIIVANRLINTQISNHCLKNPIRIHGFSIISYQ